MSIALAVLGELLTEAEAAYERSQGDERAWRESRAGARVEALREARNRVMAAETRFALPTDRLTTVVADGSVGMRRGE